MAATAPRTACLSWREMAETRRQRLKVCPSSGEGILFSFPFPIPPCPAGDELALGGREIFPTPSSPALPATML